MASARADEHSVGLTSKRFAARFSGRPNDFSAPYSALQGAWDTLVTKALCGELWWTRRPEAPVRLNQARHSRSSLAADMHAPQSLLIIHSADGVTQRIAGCALCLTCTASMQLRILSCASWQTLCHCGFFDRALVWFRMQVLDLHMHLRPHSLLALA